MSAKVCASSTSRFSMLVMVATLSWKSVLPVTVAPIRRKSCRRTPHHPGAGWWDVCVTVVRSAALLRCGLARAALGRLLGSRLVVGNHGGRAGRVLLHRGDARQRGAAGLVVLGGGDDSAVGGEQVPVEPLAGLLHHELAGHVACLHPGALLAPMYPVKILVMRPRGRCQRQAGRAPSTL